jgi:hypothetical protein
MLSQKLKLTFAILALPLIACVGEPIEEETLGTRSDEIVERDSTELEPMMPQAEPTDRLSAEEYQGGLRYPLHEIDGETEVDCSVDVPDRPSWYATECIVEPYYYQGDPVQPERDTQTQ